MNNDIDLAWAAGLFEGRGCTSVKKPSGQAKKSYPDLSLHSGDFDVLSRFLGIVKEGSIRGPRHLKGKPSWQWEVVGKGSHKVMLLIFPFLCSRQRSNALRVFGSVALGVDSEWYPGLELSYKQKSRRIQTLI